MSSWFDEVEQAEGVEEEASTRRPVKTPKVKSFGFSSHIKVLLGLLILLVVVVIGSVVVLRAIESSSDTSSSSPTSTVVMDPATQVAVAGQCEPEAGEIRLSTGDSTLRGTVAQWEKAYYSQDVQALTALLTADSWMRGQDWVTILPEAAPEGSQWCAVMSPVKNTNLVDVDLMVVFADGSSQTYQQTVIGEQNQSGWLISDIETR